jgi:hypothetical protein
MSSTEGSNDFLDLLNEEDGAGKVNVDDLVPEQIMFWSNGLEANDSEQSSDEYIEEEDEEPLYMEMQQFTEKHEEDRLLIGISEGKEVILGGFVDELISNLTTKKFGKIIWDSQNVLYSKSYEVTRELTYLAPPFVVAFLFTYRYFCTAKDDSVSPAQELLSCLRSQYPMTVPDSTTPEFQSLEGTIQLR